MKTRKSKRKIKEAVSACIFIAPFVILSCVFMFYPICQEFIRSVYDTKWGNKVVFVGLENYKKIFSNPIYVKAIQNTLLFFITAVPCIIILGIFIAGSIFDKVKKYVSAVRIILYIPTIVSTVVMSTIWRFMLNSQSGIVAYLADKFGFSRVDLLGSPTTARMVIIFVLIVINLGQCVLLYVASMIGIDKTLIDACRIDGGNRWTLFRYILIPLSRPTTVLIFITNTSLVLKVYIVIQLLTSGGPNYATTTMMYQLYQDAFVNYDIGIASAMGVLLFIMTLILISFRFIFMSKEERNK